MSRNKIPIYVVHDLQEGQVVGASASEEGARMLAETYLLLGGDEKTIKEYHAAISFNMAWKRAMESAEIYVVPTELFP